MLYFLLYVVKIGDYNSFICIMLVSNIAPNKSSKNNKQKVYSR